eukprot:7783210-Pyramimonas_sp.AAC.3
MPNASGCVRFRLQSPTVRALDSKYEEYEEYTYSTARISMIKRVHRSTTCMEEPKEIHIYYVSYERKHDQAGPPIYYMRGRHP